jgi:ABC-type lipoprotein release transport system permease subunit
VTAIWLVARSRLRERWPAWLPVVLILLIASTTVMTLTAGGRRTASVYPRFLRSQNATDVVVSAGAGIGLADLDPAQVVALPQVVESANAPAYFSLGRTGEGRLIPPRVIAAHVADSAAFAGGLDRVKILKGRAAHPDRPDEMVAHFSYEDAYGVQVGSIVTVRFTTPAGLPRLFSAINDASPEALDIGPLVTFRVVGLGVVPGQLPPVSSSGLPPMWMTPAWGQLYASTLAHINTIGVRLRDGDADVRAFKAAIEQMGRGQPTLFFTQRDSTAAVQRSFRSQTVSLYILSGLIALVLILFVGQALTQEARTQSSRAAALAAIGMTRHQRAGAFALQGLLGGVIGGTVAAAVSYLLSSTMPLGLARIVDPAPGRSFDASVLAGGAFLTAVVTVILSAVQGWRSERSTVDTSEPFASPVRPAPRSFSWLPVSAAVGLAFAYRSRRGRDSTSVATTLTGITLGLLTLIATVVFSASLGHLISTPRLWGATWQARLGDAFAPDVGGRVQSGLLADPWVQNLAAGTAVQLELHDRLRVDAFAMDPLRGHIGPLALDGRGPQAADEILLGTAALRSLGLRIGDRVNVSIGPRSAELRVVGRGPLPVGAFRDAGNSAMISFQALKTLVPDAQPNIYLVDGPVGTTPSAAAAYLAAHHPGIGVFPHELPTDFANFGRVDRLPLTIGAVLASVAVLSLVHALLSATRARRRDLAVLKTIGFVRAQIAAAVSWHATALIAASALIALPGGVIAGRWSWNLFADWIGAEAVTIVSFPQVMTVLAGALIAGLIAAAHPARKASRVKPASVFRTE